MAQHETVGALGKNTESFVGSVTLQTRGGNKETKKCEEICIDKATIKSGFQQTYLISPDKRSFGSGTKIISHQ